MRSVGAVLRAGAATALMPVGLLVGVGARAASSTRALASPLSGRIAIDPPSVPALLSVARAQPRKTAGM